MYGHLPADHFPHIAEPANALAESFASSSHPGAPHLFLDGLAARAFLDGLAARARRCEGQAPES